MVLIIFYFNYFLTFSYRSDGRSYKGNWKNGKQHGDGEFLYDDKKGWKKGVWNDGKRTSWVENQND